MKYQMNRTQHFKHLLMVGAAIAWQSTSWAAGNWFQSSERSHKSESSFQVRDAHQAFLDQRYSDMASQMKNVLTSDSSTATERENILRLLNKAYSDGVREIPVDWSLPQFIREIRFGIRRKQSSDGVYYHTGMKIDIDNGHQLTQMKLTRYPNTVVFDKEANIGEWEDSPEKLTHKISVRDASAGTPADKGLYLVDLTVDNTTRTQGWFIVSDEVSSAAPVVLYPTVGDHLTTTTPTFRWQDFRSPEYKPSESRVLGISVDSTATDNWPEAWYYYESNPKRTDVTIGDKGGEGVASLAPGPYNLTVIYRERHRFGPMLLQRESATYVPFEINHP